MKLHRQGREEGTYKMVGLETHHTLDSRLDFTLLTTLAGEGSTTKLSLQEELSVEDSGGGVEGGSWDSWVNVVGSSDGVPGRQ